MSGKTVPMRIGMAGCSSFSASVSVKHELAFSEQSSGILEAVLYISHPLIFQGESASSPVSTLFETVGTFSTFSEPYWSTMWDNSGNESSPLIDNYHHSQTPVKYTRLDDLVLSYESGKLVGVARESGDTLSLEYNADGLLIRVTDIYTGVVKNFSYTGTELTGITVAKLA